MRNHKSISLSIPIGSYEALKRAAWDAGVKRGEWIRSAIEFRLLADERAGITYPHHRRRWTPGTEGIVVGIDRDVVERIQAISSYWLEWVHKAVRGAMDAHGVMPVAFDGQRRERSLFFSMPTAVCHHVTQNPVGVKAWRETAVGMAREAVGDDPPFGHCSVTAWVNSPRDVDNIIRSCLNAMSQGGLIEDDNFVEELTVNRYNGDGVTILVEDVDRTRQCTKCDPVRRSRYHAGGTVYNVCGASERYVAPLTFSLPTAPPALHTSGPAKAWRRENEPTVRYHAKAANLDPAGEFSVYASVGFDYKGDLDNQAGTLMNVLEDAGVYNNDKQVSSLRMMRRAGHGVDITVDSTLAQTHPTPVSYTHLTLPTICSV